MAVDAVLRGDRDAFRVLVERESTAVIRACQRVLGDVHDAEDAAQEAFVTAFRSLDTWRGDGQLRGVDGPHRRPRRAPPGEPATPRDLDRSAHRRVGRRAAPTPGPRSAPRGAPATTRTRRPSRSAASATSPFAPRSRGLEEPYREVVALRFFGDLSLAEIAAVSGRPLGTVKTHLRRGLGRLRDSLAMAAVR